jgi:hypothetical protein
MAKETSRPAPVRAALSLCTRTKATASITTMEVRVTAMMGRSATRSVDVKFIECGYRCFVLAQGFHLRAIAEGRAVAAVACKPCSAGCTRSRTGCGYSPSQATSTIIAHM